MTSDPMLHPAFQVFTCSDFSLFSAAVVVPVTDTAPRTSVVHFLCPWYRNSEKSRLPSKAWGASSLTEEAQQRQKPPPSINNQSMGIEAAHQWEREPLLDVSIACSFLELLIFCGIFSVAGFCKVDYNRRVTPEYDVPGGLIYQLSIACGRAELFFLTTPRSSCPTQSARIPYYPGDLCGPTMFCLLESD